MAVLWFDLMFDVQTRGHAGEILPAEVLASIRAYYRRVTTDARPMGGLVRVVMLLTVAAIVAEIVLQQGRGWAAWVSLAAAASAIGLAVARTIPNASRLAGGADGPELQSSLARLILRDHLYCLAAIALLVTLQLVARA
ncbi:MAG: hypothetical protein ACHP84_14145 [Caulobacterales bacterium]